MCERYQLHALKENSEFKNMTSSHVYKIQIMKEMKIAFIKIAADFAITFFECFAAVEFIDQLNLSDGTFLVEWFENKCNCYTN